jgi:D-alanyl-D-alanine carboxypeptidase
MAVLHQSDRPRRGRGISALVAACAVALVMQTGAAQAAAKSAVLVVDANTGRVLHESAADAPRHPASLAKMMTIYIAFELIEQGRLSYQTKIKMSANAAAQAPSKLELEEGDEIALIDAIKVLITKSANDIAVAIAEHIAGSEEQFARLMTQKARQFGMSATEFKNASGLPDDEQVTTARDMVTLALRLQDDFPRHYPLFATREFTYKDETFRNHNTLLFSYEGTDGLKTGYTRASGFNLVASVHRGRKHVIGVVFGGATASARNAAMRTFLNMGLVKASSEKTRQPSVPLIAQARPARERRVASMAAVPTPRRLARPSALPAAATQPASAPQAVEASALQPAAAASFGPAIEMARVRSVLVTPRTAAADPGQPQPAVAAIEPRHTPAADEAAPLMPAWATPGGTAPQRLAGVPSDRPAMFADPGLGLGAAPSTLDAQAANIARGGPALTAPAPSSLPPPLPQAIAPHGLPAAPKRRIEATASTAGGMGGFQIQIGAFQSQAEAERQLAAVRERAPVHLARAAAVTSQVKQGDKMLFRARYGGFEAAAAASACGELKRLKIDCLVVKAE